MNDFILVLAAIGATVCLVLMAFGIKYFYVHLMVTP